MTVERSRLSMSTECRPMRFARTFFCPPMKPSTDWDNIKRDFSIYATYRSGCCRQIQISRSHFSFRQTDMACLWNNAALTDFDPATEVIHLDENGAGTFQTGAEGEYGFLLSGNGRGKLQLSVNDEKVIDLKNMWLPWSAGGKIHLAANTTYKVTAETGGNTELSVRAPSDTMAFRSQVGEGVDYYFIYGPEPNQVMAEYREFTGAAPLLPSGPTVSGSAVSAIQASNRFSIRRRSSASGRFPSMCLFRIGSTGGSTAGMP